MTKTRSTKRALVLSALAILMCVSMLIGSTYAWFTDSVTSARNQIVSGNLDVELYYSTWDAENNTWTEYAEVNATTKIFDENALYEPGYTEVVRFQVKNAGSLALKYNMTATVYSEEAGINVYNQPFNLSDYIYTGKIDVADAADRATAAAKATEKLGTGLNVAAGSSLLAGASEEFALVLTMPTTVGNEANHIDGHQPSIQFGIALVATQFTYEEDSFGNDYDDGAEFPGANATQAQINELAKTLSEANDGDVIYLKPLNYSNIALGSGAYPYDYPANLTIVGDNGTTFTGIAIDNEVISGWTLKNITFIGNPNDNPGSTDGIHFSTKATVDGLTIENCKFTNGAKISMINTTGASFADVTIKDCSFSDNIDSESPSILLQGVNNITVDNCTFTNAGYNALQATKMTGDVFFTNNTITNTIDRAIRFSNTGANVTVTGNTVVSNGDDAGEVMKISGTHGTITVSGNTWNGETDAQVSAGMVGSDYIVKYKVASSAEELKEALAKGGTVTLTDDITLTEQLSITKDTTINLNGKTVTSTAKKAFEVHANATIENGTIKAANRCVDTRTNVELTMTNVTLIADDYTSAYGNPQPLTIGGYDNGTKVTLNNCTISAKAGYAIITFVETELTATDSTIGGYSALYVKPGSDNSTFNFVNTDISASTGNNDVAGNSFSAIAVRANNVTVNVDADSSLTATGEYCYAISLSSTYAGEESTTGVKVTVDCEIVGNAISEPVGEGNTVTIKG